VVNETREDGYEPAKEAGTPAAALLRWGLVSFASALAGGLTVAWWYRKTLTKLQNPIAQTSLPKTGVSEAIDEDGIGEDEIGPGNPDFNAR
jgi:hypothetical protein